MLIDDCFIKKAISLYKSTRSIDTLKDINEHLSMYIYNYPRKVFRVNNEIAIDFYSYYLERLEDIILKYEESEVKFITWFTYTLRNSYINYTVSIKRKTKYKKSEVSLDSPLDYDNALTLHDVLYDSKKYYDLYNDNIDDLSSKIFNFVSISFKNRDSLFFFIHNLEIFLSYLINPIMLFFNCTYEEAYSIIEKARNTYIHKYEQILKLQDRISKITIDISINQSKNKSTKLLELKKKNNLSKLNAIKLNVPHLFIATLFETTVNTVTKVIQKIKNKIKLEFEI